MSEEEFGNKIDRQSASSLIFMLAQIEESERRSERLKKIRAKYHLDDNNKQ